MVKDFNLQIKGLDIKNRIVEGYFASFGTVDSDNDVFVQGCFAKSISENGPAGKGRIKHLYNHWDAVGVLQELTEDNFGLRYVSKIGNHTLGNDVLRMYEDGIITEHSIGFQIIDDKVEVVDGVRYIKEVKLWEGSCLDKWGANENTPVIKSAGEALEVYRKLRERMAVIEKAIKSRTAYSDETYYQLIAQIETITRMLNALDAAKSLNIDTYGGESQEHGIDISKLIIELKKR